MSLIAVDYDGTISTDPEAWGVVMAVLKLRGHEVIICTMRPEDEPIRQRFPGVLVYYSDGQAKDPFLRKMGISPDIWIDDMPYLIYDDSE